VSQAPPLSGRGWAISIAAAVGIALAFFDRQTMSVLAPVVTADLQLTDTQYGLLGSCFALALLVGSPLAGWWTARVGARRALLAALIVWSAIAMLHSFAAGFVSLLALRAALGFAEAPSVPAALETVERVLPVASRPRATGLLFVGSSVGVLVAAPLAVALAQAYGWRVAFSVAAGFGLALWLPAWLLLTANPHARAAMDERKPRRQVALSLDVFAHPATMHALAVTFAVMPLITFTTAWEGKWLVHDFGLHQTDLKLYLLPGPLLFDAGAFAFGDLASRRVRRLGDGSPPRVLFAIAALLIVAGDLCAPFAPNAVAAVGCNAVAAVGRGAIFPLVVSDMARRLPPALVAPGAAAVSGAQAAAMVVASLLIGHFVQTRGYPTVLVGLSLWVIAPCAYWLVTAKQTPRSE
jgi:MFS transporter, ACS family, aldohexuronate transporter